MSKYLKCQTIESFEDVDEEKKEKTLIPGIKNKFLFMGAGGFLAVIILYFMMSKKAPKAEE